MENTKALRDLLVRFLKGETHMGFDQAVTDFPLEAINDLPPNVPYTPWHLLEHIRRTQADILNFVTNADYQEPEWPKDYWPEPASKADSDQWEKTIEGYKADQAKMIEIAVDPKTDLYKVVPWGNGQTMVEEIMKVADHTSYHIGEFAILRQVMGTWPEDRK